MVLGIAPVEIIDRQLPLNTPSLSDQLMWWCMANGTTCSKHKPFGFQPYRPCSCQLILKPIWLADDALYDAYNEVACLMLGSMTPELHRQFENYSPYDMLQELKSMFEKQAGVERFDLIQTFHACKHEEGKPVGAYDLSVGLILNGLTSDFTGFVRNYNMHNMGKTIGELHAMLIEYEKGLPKKAETPQVMMIKGGKIQKANKKSLKAKAKDDTCHHCKEVGHWKRNFPVFLAELLKKKKQVGTASSSSIFTYNNFAFPNKILGKTIIMVQPEGKHQEAGIKIVEEIKSFELLKNLDDHSGLGEATFILGIKIYRDRSKRLIGLSQSAYMDKILKRYRMDNSKHGHIPMQERLDLNKTQGASTPEKVKHMQNVPYASAVGSIMYAVRCTRPDVSFGTKYKQGRFSNRHPLVNLTGLL
ncbi:retrotransposon protein, putative, ty1-copia subclass [Tanacetum coccineum]